MAVRSAAFRQMRPIFGLAQQKVPMPVLLQFGREARLRSDQRRRMASNHSKMHEFLKDAHKKHSGFIVSQGAFLYAFIMRNERIIKAIQRLIACGMPPCEAFLVCDDFIRRFGMRDLEACVRSVEVRHVA